MLERRWWSWGLQGEISRLGIDVFHGTDFAVPYLPLRPSVMTLHDLSPWMEPGWHAESDRVRRRTPMLLRLGLATMVITPSDAVRRAAIERFHLQHDRVVAVPHGANPAFYPGPPDRRTAVVPPYLLYVGTLEPRKNIGLILDLWRELRREHPVDLILAGRRRADFPEIPPEPGLHLLGLTPEEELASPLLRRRCLPLPVFLRRLRSARARSNAVRSCRDRLQRSGHREVAGAGGASAMRRDAVGRSRSPRVAGGAQSRYPGAGTDVRLARSGRRTIPRVFLDKNRQANESRL